MKSFSITLGDSEAELLEKVLNRFPVHEHARGRLFDRRFIVRWAIKAVCAAILRAGVLRVPFAVEIKWPPGSLNIGNPGGSTRLPGFWRN